MKKTTFRLVQRNSNGSLRIRDYKSQRPLTKMHQQIGIEDTSTDLDLRGLPVFRGLIGPMPDGDNTARYESRDVFEVATLQWDKQSAPRSRRRRNKQVRESCDLQPAT